MQSRLIVAVLVGLVGASGVHAQSVGSGTRNAAAVTGTQLPEWDVVSVRIADPQQCLSKGARIRYTQDGMNSVCEPLLGVIEQAYALLQPSLIMNAPEWVKTDKLWNIEAKVSGSDASAFNALSPSEKYRMMRSVLVERFHLKARIEQRVVPVYALILSKGGPKLKEATADESGKGHLWMRSAGELEGVDVAMKSLPLMLNGEVGRTIVDRTGLTGRYDFTLKYLSASKEAIDETSSPSIFTAIQEQLGLKLEPAKASQDVLVIESVEQPTTN